MTCLIELVWNARWIDPYLQQAVGLSALIGAVFSTYAIWRTRRQLNLLKAAGVNGERRSVLHLHLYIHWGIWWTQVILLSVSLMMLTIPPLPIAMYVSTDGKWILVVLAYRKFARLVTSLIMLAVTVYKVRWLHWHCE